MGTFRSSRVAEMLRGAGCTAHGLLAVATGHGLRLIGRRSPQDLWPHCRVKTAMSPIKSESVAKVRPAYGLLAVASGHGPSIRRKSLHQLHPEHVGCQEPLPCCQAKAAMSSIPQQVGRQEPLPSCRAKAAMSSIPEQVGSQEPLPCCRAKAAMSSLAIN